MFKICVQRRNMRGYQAHSLHLVIILGVEQPWLLVKRGVPEVWVPHRPHQEVFNVEELPGYFFIIAILLFEVPHLCYGCFSVE